MNRVLNSVVLRRVLAIFIVGLISRSLVNIVFDINVFKEYYTAISLLYYGFMAYFSAMIHELPMGLPMCDSNYGNNINKSSTMVYKDSVGSDRSVSAGHKGLYGNRGATRRPSAALRGLYSQDNNKDTFKSDSFGFRRNCKARLLWTVKQFSNEFGSYKEYSQHLGKNFSIREELKKTFRKG